LLAQAEKASSTLSAPLSEFIKDLPQVPVSDIAAYLSRSAAVHQSEATNSKDKARSPLNTFMLYLQAAYRAGAKKNFWVRSGVPISEACGER